MTEYQVNLEPIAAAFYLKVADAAGKPVEQVLADALFMLAGELSIDAIARSEYAHYE